MTTSEKAERTISETSSGNFENPKDLNGVNNCREKISK